MPFLEDLRRALDAEKRLTADRVCAIVAEHWGGERVYVPKQYDGRQIELDTTPKDLIESGVPKTTAYRKVKRKWVGRW